MLLFIMDILHASITFIAILVYIRLRTNFDTEVYRTLGANVNYRRLFISNDAVL